LLRVFRVRNGEVTDSSFWLDPRGLVGGIQRVDATLVRIEESAGTYQLRIRTIGTSDWQDSVHFRRGYADTLVIGLGNPWLCGL
jgi:hypothetical protein